MITGILLKKISHFYSLKISLSMNWYFPVLNLSLLTSFLVYTETSIFTFILAMYVTFYSQSMPRKHIEFLHISFTTIKYWRIKVDLPKPNWSIAPLTLSLLWLVKSRLNNYLTKKSKTLWIPFLSKSLYELIWWLIKPYSLKEWNHCLLTKVFQKLFTQVMCASWLKKLIIICTCLHPIWIRFSLTTHTYIFLGI